MLSFNELKSYLDEKHDLYNRPSFVETDPIQIPHRFSLSEDIEIASFLSSTIAWGQRKSIIKNASRMMDILGNSPYDFIMNADEKHFDGVNNFVHRTFNSTDLLFFLTSLRNIYRNRGGLKNVFESNYLISNSVKDALIAFRRTFFEIEYPQRTMKHVSDVENNSAGKRLNLFLMWMVRKDNRGVHFGIWDKIPMSALYIPLDVHSGNIGRMLGLLTRKQNDWKAVDELTEKLRLFDANDPIKYDFALFGVGVNGELI